MLLFFQSHSSPSRSFLPFPLSAPCPPRRRCLSCSDNSLDLSLDASGNGDNVLPDVIVTKRNRSDSVCNRILEEEESGTVKYFCRSRGHGFICSEKVKSCLDYMTRPCDIRHMTV